MSFYFHKSVLLDLFSMRFLFVCVMVVVISACSSWKSKPKPVVDFPDCAIEAIYSVKNVEFERSNSERKSVVASTPYNRIELLLELGAEGQETVLVESFGPKRELTSQQNEIVHQLLNLVTAQVARVCGSRLRSESE